MPNQLNKIKVCAHRGASSTHPENTTLAFEQAIRIGAPMIEFDVRRTADDKFVIIHDATVDRTTNGTGEVAKLTLEQLRQLDAGQGAQIPTLDEVLEYGQSVILNVQAKVETPEDVDPLAKVLAQKIADKNLYNNAFVSAELAVLQKVQRIDSRIRLCALFSTSKAGSYVDDVIEKMPACSILQPNHSIVSRQMVEKAHKHGLKVNPFYANDQKTARHFAECGVDGILTDKPAEMIGWLGLIEN